LQCRDGGILLAIDQENDPFPSPPKETFPCPRTLVLQKLKKYGVSLAPG
jgi:hypothetical protein